MPSFNGLGTLVNKIDALEVGYLTLMSITLDAMIVQLIIVQGITFTIGQWILVLFIQLQESVEVSQMFPHTDEEDMDILLTLEELIGNTQQLFKHSIIMMIDDNIVPDGC